MYVPDDPLFDITIQGSVRGPLLFLIIINNSDDGIESVLLKMCRRYENTGCSGRRGTTSTTSG